MSKITIKQLELGLAQYVERELIPNIPTMTITPFGNLLPIEINPTLMQFIGGVGMFYGTLGLEKYVPTLQSIGILDNSGMIDITELTSIMKTQLEKVGGELPIGPLTFSVNDIDIIRQYALNTATTVNV